VSDQPSPRKASKALYTAALFLFAAVGFVASITTIYDVFYKGKARLTAQIYPSNLSFPFYFYKVMGTGQGDNGRAFLNRLGENCQTSEVAGTSQADEAKKTSHSCEHVNDLKFLSDNISDMYTSLGTVLTIDLENRGETKASGIKLNSHNFLFMDVYSNGSRIRAEYKPDSSSYSLPEINPGEGYRLVIWRNGSAYSNGKLYDFQLPKITYDGPPVEIEQYAYSSGVFYEVPDFIRSAGPVFGTIFVLCFCIFVSLGLLLVVGLVAQIVQGRPVSEMFKPAPAKE
jgi:hypothetical protein